ncbi:MAG: TlyA family RNA methyltransferase [Syntrophobacterales bacterium]|nr:TlyA family RNA methyltransferase [Syntrophobacterales bacterium]
MTKKENKTRLDLLLVRRGFVPSREQARALILAGRVLVNDLPVDKAGSLAADTAEIRITGNLSPYVSRGGEKIQGALEIFSLNVSGWVVLDVGASTGGFTDCLLQRGARKVYALDVGYGQLAWKLRSDCRVVPLERTNIRYFDGSSLTEPIDLATIDASFISLKLVLPKVASLVKPGGAILALIKPQFEVGAKQVGKNGVVSDTLLHQQVVADIAALCRDLNMEDIRTCDSPLLGPAGNKEFFILAQLPAILPSLSE